MNGDRDERSPMSTTTPTEPVGPDQRGSPTHGHGIADSRRAVRDYLRLAHRRPASRTMIKGMLPGRPTRQWSPTPWRTPDAPTPLSSATCSVRGRTCGVLGGGLGAGEEL